MADWRRLREALFSVFIIVLPIYVCMMYCSVYCLVVGVVDDLRRIDAGVRKKMDGVGGRSKFLQALVFNSGFYG